MYCKNSNDYKENEMPKTDKAAMAVLSPENEIDFIVRKVTIQSGGSIPNHTNEIQHQQYVLSGEVNTKYDDRSVYGNFERMLGKYDWSKSTKNYSNEIKKENTYAVYLF